MCGIAGTYRWPDGKVVADRLTETLAHRGPDGAGRYSHPVGDGEVHLGHRFYWPSSTCQRPAPSRWSRAASS